MSLRAPCARVKKARAPASRPVRERVERRDAVGLGPDAHRTRAGNVRVVELDVRLAVERHLDAGAREVDAQRMPRAARDRRVDVLDRLAAAALPALAFLCFVCWRLRFIW